jgi:hypothetical protein
LCSGHRAGVGHSHFVSVLLLSEGKGMAFCALQKCRSRTHLLIPSTNPTACSCCLPNSTGVVAHPQTVAHLLPA